MRRWILPAQVLIVGAVLAIFVTLPIPKTRAAVNYDGNKAATWMLNNTLHSLNPLLFYGASSGCYDADDCAPHYLYYRDCAAGVARALHEGGIDVLPDPYAVSGNHQIINWMASTENQGIWEFQNNFAALEPGDFILASILPISAANYTWTGYDGLGGWSHSMLVTGSNVVSMWNPELINMDPYWYSFGPGMLPIISRVGVHIIRDDRPRFTSQPTSQTIPNGQTVTLSVVTTGQGTTYQWYQGAAGDTSNPITGANSDTFTTPTLNSGSYSYWVQAINQAGATDSDAATITVSDIAVNPQHLSFSAAGTTQNYTITFATSPSQPVNIQIDFNPAVVQVNGSNTSPISISIADMLPQTLTVTALVDGPLNGVITHTISPNSAPEYLGWSVSSVTFGIQQESLCPPAPPVPNARDWNFVEGASVRTKVPDYLAETVFVRHMISNGQYVSWCGSAMYNSGSIGDLSVISHTIVQAVDVYTQSTIQSFGGDVVVCLEGLGEMIFMSANTTPRQASSTTAWMTDAYPGFTCATLYEPGTLVLVEGEMPSIVASP